MVGSNSHNRCCTFDWSGISRLNVLLVLVTLSFLWGSSFLAIKLVIHVVPPILAFGIRFAIAGAALLIAYIVNERERERE
jgi:drug/metabolite transporter (DMT)-like permease